MARKRSRAPYRPVSDWDTGPDTAAQRADKVIEDAGEIDPRTGRTVNPNGVKRARRTDIVEMYQRKGVLDARQVKAAKALRAAFEATMKGPPAIQIVQVDRSLRPDANVAVAVDRVSRYARMMGLVPAAHREIVETVAIDNRAPRWLRKYRGSGFARGIERMQTALAELADRLEGG